MLKTEDLKWTEQLIETPLESLKEEAVTQDERSPYDHLIPLKHGGSLLNNESCLHLIEIGSDVQKSLQAIWYYVNQLDKPLTCIFISHRQDHTVKFMHQFKYLQSLKPKQFKLELICHQKNRQLALDGIFYGLVQDEEFIKLDGRSYFLAKTPGHSQRNDHIIMMEMKNKILFFGSLLQPQGESYEYCTFMTPLGYHYNPDLVYKSILFLKSLPFEAGVSLNGEVLDYSRTYRWMEITQKIIERTAHYARKSLWEIPPFEIQKNNYKHLAQKVYIDLAMERNLDLDVAYNRINEDTQSFNRYDRPMIDFFLRKFQS